MASLFLQKYKILQLVHHFTVNFYQVLRSGMSMVFPGSAMICWHAFNAKLLTLYAGGALGCKVPSDGSW